MAENYMIADQRNPYMGLNNKVCKEPVYWCKNHKIWLSEEDVTLKHCKEKPTFDLLGVSKCNGLVENRVLK